MSKVTGSIRKVPAPARRSWIAGVVLADGEPVSGAYVRLLDATGEFTAEVVTSPEGAFRFFAAPGKWTVRALSRAGNGDADVSAQRGINQLTLPVAQE
ncbi:MAG: DUF1416 domain-containing protein [Micromonosporaceae bacterium]